MSTVDLGVLISSDQLLFKQKLGVCTFAFGVKKNGQILDSFRLLKFLTYNMKIMAKDLKRLISTVTVAGERNTGSYYVFLAFSNNLLPATATL